MEYEMMFAVKAMRFQSSLGTVGRAVQAMVRGLVMLFVLACCVLRAEEAAQKPTSESVARVSPAAPAVQKWTASDLIAMGLMVLGAVVVFIPVPNLRTGQGTQKPTEAPVREACRPAPHGNRSSMGSDRSSVQQVSTV